MYLVIDCKHLTSFCRLPGQHQLQEGWLTQGQLATTADVRTAVATTADARTAVAATADAISSNATTSDIATKVYASTFEATATYKH
jgi:hypothetical protein